MGPTRQAVAARRRGPRLCQQRRLPTGKVSRLGVRAFRLAVYASRRRSPAALQDSLPAAGRLYRMGLDTHRAAMKAVLSAISSQFRRFEESENGFERKSSGGLNRLSVWTSAVSLATMRVSSHSSRQGDGDVIIPPARPSVRLFRCLRFHPGQTVRPPLALTAFGEPPGQGPGAAPSPPGSEPRASMSFRRFYNVLCRRTPRPAAAGLFCHTVKPLMLRFSGGQLVFAIDDTPTNRYGPFIQGAGIHHNPTPGPAGEKFLYGHLCHARLVGPPSPLRRPGPAFAGPALRPCQGCRRLEHRTPRVPLALPHQAGTGGRAGPLAAVLAGPNDQVDLLVVDGGYAKRPFLRAFAGTRPDPVRPAA